MQLQHEIKRATRIRRDPSRGRAKADKQNLAHASRVAIMQYDEYCDCMALRTFTAFFVVLIVFPVCYYAWFWAINLIPPEFGMPTYEEEIELAFLVGSVAFSVVPLFISIRVCGFLNRCLLIRRMGSDDLTP